MRAPRAAMASQWSNLAFVTGWPPTVATAAGGREAPRVSAVGRPRLSPIPDIAARKAERRRRDRELRRDMRMARAYPSFRLPRRVAAPPLAANQKRGRPVEVSGNQTPGLDQAAPGQGL